MKNCTVHRVTRITTLISISLAGLGTAAAQPQGLVERLRALNNNLLQLHSRAQSAPASTLADLRSQAAVVAKDRSAVLETLIRQSPGDALALAFSQDTINRLAETFPQSAAQLESQGKWQGSVEYLIFDDRNLQAVQSLIRIKTSRGTMVVHFAGHEPAGLKGGDVLEVSGVTVNNNIAAMGGTIVSESAGTLAACTPSGPQNVAIISVTFPGVAPTISTSALYSAAFGTSGHSLDGYWRDASYGKASATGNVFGPYTLSQAYSCDQTDQMLAAAVAAADPYVNFQNYSRVMVVFPLPAGCAWAGLGTVGCGSISTQDGVITASTNWMIGDYMTPNDYAVQLMAHEAGHNLGLMHSRSRDFGADAIGPLGASGTYDEYGDHFSAMGYWNFGHYPPSQKVQLGWLGSGNVQTVQGPGTFSIQPYGTASSLPQALKVQRGTGNNDWMWLEYKQPVGSYESTLSSQVFSGPTIHYSDSYTGSYTDLVDFTPLTTSWADPALAAGQVWTDPYSNVSLAVQGATSSSATVQVNYGSVPCVRANPVVTFSPLNPSVNAGSPANYTVSIANGDSSGCTSSTFGLTSSQPAGWNATLSSSSVTLNPGQTGPVTLQITPPSGTTAGTYPVGLNAADAYGTGTGAANLTVMTPPPPPPPPAPVAVTVSIPSTTYPVKTNVPISATVLSGTSAAPGATVTFSVRNPNGSTTTATATAGSTGVATYSYRVNPKGPAGIYTVTAQATYSGQSAASVPVTFTVK